MMGYIYYIWDVYIYIYGIYTHIYIYTYMCDIYIYIYIYISISISISNLYTDMVINLNVGILSTVFFFRVPP